jgi:glycogen phosphorylase
MQGKGELVYSAATVPAIDADSCQASANDVFPTFPLCRPPRGRIKTTGQFDGFAGLGMLAARKDEVMSPNPPVGQPPSGFQDGVDSLTVLAMDLHWTWSHGTDELWRKLDPGLWEKTRHPNVVLKNVSRDRLQGALADPSFRDALDRLIRQRNESSAAAGWFQRNYPGSPLSCVAYFCMEFMLSEALPIYSGGLGNVAGDQLKAASDLGVPVIGVGLLYQHGYFRQVIDRNGDQQALYPYNDPAQLPITPVKLPNGELLKVGISLPGYTVWLRAWQVQVGRAQLFLLDTNDAANDPIHRGITGELYGGSPELRLKQEIVLGLGGWRLLAALGIKPEVCHLNEGHAAFALLERARSFMKESGCPFGVALTATRVGNLFTTHTAVPAGFDLFPGTLVEQYLGRYAQDDLGIAMPELLALGRRNPDDPAEAFNMAYLAIRGSGAVNGVSKLHGKISRRIFTPLFPRWPEEEVPVGHVTNGVHVPTWDSAAADALWTDGCGKGLWREPSATLETDFRRIPDETLWALRSANRKALVEFACDRQSLELASFGTDPQTVSRARGRLDPEVLTLGFGRRFAAYKRPNLLLHDPERLIRLLKNPERPAQLIIAGKAHPADQAGQALIQAWTHFIRHESSPPVIFLADYDMLLAERMVQGVDVWINTPRRPWEACGTSGMKALVNGGINLSELDGWWAEAYGPQVGWALGDGREHGEDAAWDAAESQTLYQLLEQEVIPEFYTRNAKNIPAAWVARMRESMAQLTPQFDAGRAVRQYTGEHYVSAAAAYHRRIGDGGLVARELIDRRNALNAKWPSVRFGAVSAETSGGNHAFAALVFLSALKPDEIRVELYAEGRDGDPAAVLKMIPVGATPDAMGYSSYHCSVSSSRPASDFTARIVPVIEGLSVPLELGSILWQK